ncbi:hypothetical protein LPB140_11745 [Sphingorhabdus lutea]|uniref:Serine aminopeptidase S33 domain-containing protein n=1 Tax=Sphingorhabdus lutea TaxID=1913578 RepID=A0A1L3JE15_9SPHN|nr:alpha/beta hydrolase [Sphingorhabdus lutea]APG63349.1 hypothetical protein LPB140_11745 [Sphingorhabdus lutea]
MENLQKTEYYLQGSGLKSAYLFHEGDGPVHIFLPGYMSDMSGSKASAIWQYCTTNKHACLLFDYSGCGQSDGEFQHASLSIWCEEILELIAHICPHRRYYFIGSSMGGWLMLLLAQAIQERSGKYAIAGLIGIAAAPDFTSWGYNDAQKQEIMQNGVVYEENPYGPEPTPMWQKFWLDGENNKQFEGHINIHAPIYLLHGMADADVPYDISIKLAEAVGSANVQLYLVKDGDHRLSRDEDISLLIETLHKLNGCPAHDKNSPI